MSSQNVTYNAGNCNVIIGGGALVLNRRIGGTFPSSTFAGGFSETFPTVTTQYVGSFVNNQNPLTIRNEYQGAVLLTYEQLDAEPTSNASFTAYDELPNDSNFARIVGVNDFNGLSIESESGDFYCVYGRGFYTFSGPNHTWRYTFDFTNMIEGYLPRGAFFSISDFDGPGSNETIIASKTGGNGLEWLALFDKTLTGHSEFNYNAVLNRYELLAATPTGNGTATYITTQNIDTLILDITSNAVGGSCGFKLFTRFLCT